MDKNLISSVDLLKATFQIIKSKSKNLVILLVLYGVANIIVTLISAFGLVLVQQIFSIKNLFLNPFLYLTFVFYMVTANLSWIAMVYVVDRDSKPMEALKLGWEKLLPALWITLMGMVIIGLGFIAFIIPGIILGVWFCFALYIFILEDVGGWDAFKKSKEMVKGRFWEVLKRIAVFYLSIMLIIFIADFFFSNNDIIDSIVGIIFLPYNIIYFYLMYKNFKEQKI